MKIALASPPFPKSLNDGLEWAETLIKDASDQRAEIICFPESYLPGYPLAEFNVGKPGEDELKKALDKVCDMAARHHIMVIMPMEWYHEGGFYILAHVVSQTGKLLGYQTKNQLDPTEDDKWLPGTRRNIFELNGIKFGIVICHEGFRYPETVRWAAIQGAKIVFHPHCAGSNLHGKLLVEWGHTNNPYYEKAQMVRAMENTIFFATSNYSFVYPESASALIAPDGRCMAYQPYGKPGVVVAEFNPDDATAKLANRFRSEAY